MAESHLFTVKKEMGITHKEFFRIFSQVMAGRDYQISGQQIICNEASKRLDVSISDEQVRRIGPLLRLPVTHVELNFFGYSDADRVAYLEWFDMNYFRGGG